LLCGVAVIRRHYGVLATQGNAFRVIKRQNRLSNIPAVDVGSAVAGLCFTFLSFAMSDPHRTRYGVPEYDAGNYAGQNYECHGKPPIRLRPLQRALVNDSE